jgi:hypothetical protein
MTPTKALPAPVPAGFRAWLQAGPRLAVSATVALAAVLPFLGSLENPPILDDGRAARRGGPHGRGPRGTAGRGAARSHGRGVEEEAGGNGPTPENGNGGEHPVTVTVT